MRYPKHIQDIKTRLKTNTILRKRHLVELTDKVSLDEAISNLQKVKASDPNSTLEWVYTEACCGEDCYCEGTYTPVLTYEDQMTPEERNTTEQRLDREIKYYEQQKRVRQKAEAEAKERQRKLDERMLKRLAKENPELLKQALDGE